MAGHRKDAVLRRWFMIYARAGRYTLPQIGLILGIDRKTCWRWALEGRIDPERQRMAEIARERAKMAERLDGLATPAATAGKRQLRALGVAAVEAFSGSSAAPPASWPEASAIDGNDMPGDD